MEPGPASKDIAVETRVVEWRRKVTDTVLATSAIVYLPGLILWFSGQGPPVAWPVKSLALLAYFIGVAGALFRHVDHRVRVWVVLTATYLLSLFASVALPQGPFMRSLPIPLAILALVLTGERAGRIATGISALILLFGPFLRGIPGLVEFVTEGPVSNAQTFETSFLLTQGFGLAATLVGLMILLGSFHRFLLAALYAERRSSISLEHEVAERVAAHQRLKSVTEERWNLERELDRISDEERRSLGQDVHDGLCQQLTGAVLRCQAMDRRLQRGAAVETGDVNALASLLDEAIDEAYAIAKGLNPMEPEPGALVHALRSLAKRTRGTGSAQCEVQTTGDVCVDDPAMAHHMYRIAQEAVSNAVRHGEAGRIDLELHGHEDALVLLVQDNGAGLPDKPAAHGMGLRTMAFRAQAMEGELTVERVPEGGTRVVCRAPRVVRTRSALTRTREALPIEPGVCEALPLEPSTRETMEVNDGR